jgi:surface polysaccharide O-acyltransferase-like enzyme
MNEKKRFYDIDWLRVIGMLLIFTFHTARFFDDEDWHVKNFQLDFGMSVYIAILVQFIMPLFFMLSAIAIYFALQRRTGREFMRERVNRLLIPLVFGIFTHVMLQVYIERFTHGDFSGTFWQFIPHYFDGWYGFGGNFAWMGLHLWYLLMLSLFSWLLLPLFQRIRKAEAFKARLADFFTRPFAIYLFFIAITLMEIVVGLSPDTVGMRSFGGWSPFTYLVIFLLGYILAIDERYRPAIERVRFVSLTFGLLATAIGFYLALGQGVSTYSPLFSLVRGFNTWAWLLIFLGFASRHLNFSNGFLKYANEAVLPFYILHQSVIVSIGYFIRDWQLAVFPKYLFLASVSFIIIMILYEFVVKRVAFLRLLFGMKG